MCFHALKLKLITLRHLYILSSIFRLLLYPVNTDNVYVYISLQANMTSSTSLHSDHHLPKNL